jgi:hypothetical protein
MSREVHVQFCERPRAKLPGPTLPGKLGAPIINKFDPENAKKNSSLAALNIIGDRLGSVSQVKFDNIVRVPKLVTSQLVTVPLDPKDLADVHTFKVAVVGENGESPSKDWEVTF